MKIRILTGLFVLVLSALFISCDEDKVTSPEGGNEEPEIITRDNCIELLEEAFNEIDIKKYRRLLLKPDTNNVFREGYIWYNQYEDFQSGAVPQQSLTYYQDIEATDSLFAHAVEADLELFPETWDSLEVFREKPCADCWQAIVNYQMYIYADHWHYYGGYFFLRLVIGPDPDVEDSYLIYRAEDLRRITDLRPIPSVSEDVSLGEIKAAFIDFSE